MTILGVVVVDVGLAAAKAFDDDVASYFLEEITSIIRQGLMIIFIDTTKISDDMTLERTGNN